MLAAFKPGLLLRLRSKISTLVICVVTKYRISINCRDSTTVKFYSVDFQRRPGNET